MERRCIICDARYERAMEAEHRLCPRCVERRHALRTQIAIALDDALRERERIETLWMTYQAGLDEALAARWATLCASRNIAEGVVIAYTRGRLAQHLTREERERRLAQAQRRLSDVNAKIARTRAVAPEIAQLLEREARYRRDRARIDDEIARLRRLREEIDICDALPTP